LDGDQAEWPKEARGGTVDKCDKLTAARPSWTAFDGWQAPHRKPEWAAFDAWSASFAEVLAESAARLDEALATWDAELSDIGGDPCRYDWARFRPLRLHREEDWSDWLAELLEASASGRFAARLFAGSEALADSWHFAEVDREVVAGPHRADLVARVGSEWIHIEVKVGDLNLDKTPDTAAALREAFPARTFRADYLLLPDEDTLCWDEARAQLGDRAASIVALTWRQLAVALRRSLAERDQETVRWRSWAAALLGAVEQLLLPFTYRPAGTPITRRPGRLRHDVMHASYLEESEHP